jgi:NAD(P)-dependent dehydrogenase (short-subunit alcohol dehydrogenase family)
MRNKGYRRNSGYLRADKDFYVEPRWVVYLLLDVEKFEGEVLDFYCGSGTIPSVCLERGIPARGSDIVDRAFGVQSRILGGGFFRDRSPPTHRRDHIMTTATAAGSTGRVPELRGQTVVVIGGSAGIGLETARRARTEGASVILTGRNPERLKQAALELDAQRTAAFDATDPVSLQAFFQDLPTPIDHVMVTAGAPHYGPPLKMPPEEARRGLTEHLLLALEVARGAADKVRPPGSLVFMGGTGGRRPRAGYAIISTVTVALPTLIANLALELAPIRVNLIAAGFVDTPLSASLLGDDLDKQRDELRATLPIRRVVGPADVAALAIHIMSNTALTGATYDIDGGEQLVW